MSNVKFKILGRRAFPATYIVKIKLEKIKLENPYTYDTPNLDSVIIAIHKAMPSIKEAIDASTVEFTNRKVGKINNIPKNLQDKNGNLIGTIFK